MMSAPKAQIKFAATTKNETELSCPGDFVVFIYTSQLKDPMIYSSILQLTTWDHLLLRIAYEASVSFLTILLHRVSQGEEIHFEQCTPSHIETYLQIPIAKDHDSPR